MDKGWLYNICSTNIRFFLYQVCFTLRSAAFLLILIVQLCCCHMYPTCKHISEGQRDDHQIIRVFQHAATSKNNRTNQTIA